MEQTPENNAAKLSIIMPVYNEIQTLETILNRVRDVDIDKEIIVVDDGSTDGSREFLQELDWPELNLILQPRNQGKGSAVRAGIAAAQGECLLIQDADLEYYPEEYPKLLEPILDGRADVVYGTRFLGTHRVFMFWHFLANRLLSLLTNILYNTMLTDMETCYKVFRAEVIKGITIRSNGFDLEPEITAKIFKQGWRVYEVPISYDGRGYDEGKKITWRDAFWAVVALIRYRVSD